MKNILAISVLAMFPAFAAAQDAVLLRADFPEPRPFLQQGQGGQVAEEWVTPHLRGSISLYGRAIFPGDTLVTLNGVTYSDILNPGLGLSLEAGLLGEVGPHFAVGGYISVSRDWFQGRAGVDMLTGEVFSFDTMIQTTVMVGAKVLERISPFVSWEGRIGGGFVRSGQLTFTDLTALPPNTGFQFFQPISRGVFELGARICFGDRHAEFDLGFGMRAMGAMSPGANTSFLVLPDIFLAYTLELGLTFRF